MDAHFLLIIFDSTYLAAMSAWVGSVLFVSFALAPLIFQILPADWAAKFVRALFPRYYAWGAIAGPIALAACVSGPLCYPEFRGPRVAAQAIPLIVGILVMLYAGNSLTPAINAARDAGPSEQARFERLHRRSVWLNGLVLLIGIGSLIAFATRPAPTTRGLLEPTPLERSHWIEQSLRQKQQADPSQIPSSQPIAPIP